MKYIGVALFLLGTVGLAGHFYMQQEAPALKASVFDLFEKAQNAGIDVEKWHDVADLAKEEIPPLPGLFKIRNVFGEVPAILEEVNALQDEFSNTQAFAEAIPMEQVERTFAHLQSIDASLTEIAETVSLVPDWIVTEDIRAQKQELEDKITVARETLQSILVLEPIILEAAEQEDRLLIVLQNPNEPRSTGGFMGSVVVVDFSPENIAWKFQDIYAIDRNIPENQLVLTPDWFQGLSKHLSLRDANFWPDFPTSADKIRHLFTLAGEQSPETVLAVTPELVRVWLDLIHGTRMSKWGVDFTPENFDLVLQFLVESKIQGRWGVKKPVIELFSQMMAPYALARISPEEVENIDWDTFLAEKHIQGHSRNPRLQNLFDHWKITNRLDKEADADNFLAFDFISIGANKSEKFVWSRLEHNSLIASDGSVQNTLKITRTHALKQGEIQAQLGVSHWSQNVRDLLTPDILWKLGAGENRTMLRVWVPYDVEFISGISPSGTVRAIPRAEKDFTMLEIPMNVLPGETLTAEVKYKTRIARGTQNWRPYNVQLVGTPAREQTKLIPTISVVDDGKFTAETENVGLPIDLHDDNVRAVVEWE